MESHFLFKDDQDAIDAELVQATVDVVGINMSVGREKCVGRHHAVCQVGPVQFFTNRVLGKKPILQGPEVPMDEDDGVLSGQDIEIQA